MLIILVSFLQSSALVLKSHSFFAGTMCLGLELRVFVATLDQYHTVFTFTAERLQSLFVQELLRTFWTNDQCWAFCFFGWVVSRVHMHTCLCRRCQTHRWVTFSLHIFPAQHLSPTSLCLLFPNLAVDMLNIFGNMLVPQTATFCSVGHYL